MSALIINFPDEATKQEAVEALSIAFGYTAKVKQRDNGGSEYLADNPKSREQFAIDALGEQIKKHLINYRGNKAAQAAQEAARKASEDLKIGA